MTLFKLIINIIVKNILGSILLTLALSGCVNLKHIHEYSSSALDGINKIDEVDYGFARHCLDRCQLTAIDSFKIYRKLNCPCDLYERADSVVRILYKAVAGYFSGLSSLSKNDLIRYRVDPLKKALKEEDLKVFVVKKDEVGAYTKLVDVLLRAFTDSFRQGKIKEYIRSANPSLQVLLSKLEFIESQNLQDLLEFKKERLFEQYQGLLKRHGLSDYEKQRITAEYYQASREIENFQKQISLYSKSLGAIARGHQKIAENLNTISGSDLKRSLTFYASEIQDLIFEFNKLKHRYAWPN